MTAYILQLSVSLLCFCFNPSLVDPWAEHSTSHFYFQVCYLVYWGAVQHLAVAPVTKLVALDEVKVHTGYLYLGIIIVEEYAVGRASVIINL